MLAKSATFFISAVFLFSVVIVDAQNRKCILQDNCEKCLLIDPACAWCTDRNYNLKKPRCMTESELQVAGCESVYQNKYVALEILENKALMDYSSSAISGSITGGSSASKSTLNSGSSSKTESSSSSAGGGSKSSSSQSGSSSNSAGSKSSSGQEANVIQIQPQRLKLSIAKGKESNCFEAFRYLHNKKYLYFNSHCINKCTSV